MRLKFKPQRRNDTPELSRAGETLTVNGHALDLSGLPEGGELPTDAIDTGTPGWIAPPGVSRQDGELIVNLYWPVGRGQTFDPPADIVDPPDGPVALPGKE